MRWVHIAVCLSLVGFIATRPAKKDVKNHDKKTNQSQKPEPEPIEHGIEPEIVLKPRYHGEGVLPPPPEEIYDEESEKYFASLIGKKPRPKSDFEPLIRESEKYYAELARREKKPEPEPIDGREPELVLKPITHGRGLLPPPPDEIYNEESEKYFASLVGRKPRPKSDFEPLIRESEKYYAELARREKKLN